MVLFIQYTLHDSRIERRKIMEKPRLVIIEDEPDMRLVLRELFEPDFEVLEVSTATEAFKIIPELKEIQPLPVIILDGSIPYVGDGERVAVALRAEIPKIRILGLSADNPTYGDINLKKPWKLDELEEAIQTLAN